MGGPLRLWRSFLHGRKNNTSNSLSRPTTNLLLTKGILYLQAIGGSLWHGIKGFRNSPYGERRIGALTAIKARAPVLGGNFGVWGGLFSTYDCAVKGIRKKEDPYNASKLGEDLEDPDVEVGRLR